MRGPINVDSLRALPEILQRFIEAHQKNDVEAQRDILRQLIERERVGYQRKLRLLAKLKTLVQEARAAKEGDECVRRLVTAFKFAADLRAIGYDELDDQETGATANQAAYDTFKELEAMGPGDPVFIALLDDPSLAVRASAGALLLDRMPERAIPVIEDIQRTARGTDASINAGFSLAMYRAEMTRRS